MKRVQADLINALTEINQVQCGFFLDSTEQVFMHPNILLSGEAGQQSRISSGCFIGEEELIQFILRQIMANTAEFLPVLNCN